MVGFCRQGQYCDEKWVFSFDKCTLGVVSTRAIKWLCLRAEDALLGRTGCPTFKWNSIQFGYLDENISDGKNYDNVICIVNKVAQRFKS